MLVMIVLLRYIQKNKFTFELTEWIYRVLIKKKTKAFKLNNSKNF